MSQTQMTKDRWIELFQAVGMDADAMQRWHRAFETRYPAEHQAFLEWLAIPADEIVRIRAG
jgi:hypothetical protein